MSFSVDAVANEFLKLARDANDGTVTPMKLQKLVYFAHGWHWAFFGKPLIKEQIQVWAYGPVVPSLYREFKDLGNQPINRQALEMSYSRQPSGEAGFQWYAPTIDDEPGEPADKANAKAMIKSTWEAYRKYSAVQLSELTHAKGTPWEAMKKQMGSKMDRQAAIPEQLIRDWFTAKLQPTQSGSGNL